MAAPSIRGSTAPVTGLTTTSPAGTQIGDLVLCFLWERAAATIPTFTLQGGFTEVKNQPHSDGSTSGRLACASKVATASGAQSYQPYTSSIGTDTWIGCLVLTAGTFTATVAGTGAVTGTGNQPPNPVTTGSITTGKDYLAVICSAWYLSSAATATVTPGNNGVPTGAYTQAWNIAGSQTSELSVATLACTALSGTTIDPPAWTDDVTPAGTSSLTLAFQASSTVITEADGGATGTGAGSGVSGSTDQVDASAAGSTGGSVAGVALWDTVGAVVGTTGGTVTAASVLPAVTASTEALTADATGAALAAGVAASTGAASDAIAVQAITAATAAASAAGAADGAGEDIGQPTGPTTIEADGAADGVATVLATSLAIVGAEIAADGTTTIVAAGAVVWLGTLLSPGVGLALAVSGATVGSDGAVQGTALTLGAGADGATTTSSAPLMLFHHHYAGV